MYETFYKLTGKPFQLNPDPSFYFASKGHNRAYAYMKYGVYQAEGFIVLTGEIGAGKTTMVRTLLGDVDDSRIVAAQLNSTQLDADDLVHAVGAAFGLPIKDVGKAEMINQFETFLTSLTDSGRRALLIVDEAQNLTPGAMEELRMLSNFQLGTAAMLQSFLVGQPELREILRSPTMTQLRQRIIASYHLGPMDKDETQAYIRHRLERVGWTGDPAFEDAAFEPLFAVTRGLPRLINGVCDRLMLGACMEEKHVIDAASVQATIDEMRSELGTGSLAAELPVPPREAGATVRPVTSAALATRLERIEKKVALAVELLQQISSQVPAPAAPASERRSRFGARPQRN